MMVLPAFIIYSLSPWIDPWFVIYGVCLLVTFFIQIRILRGIFGRLKKAGISEKAYKTTIGYLSADRKLNPKKRDRSIFLGLVGLEALSLVFFAVYVVRSTLYLR